ncbi:putative transcriptional regulator [Niabella drilacis]|uniref:Putative transcriptional regulator n=2 Tax=Niabella drilacis (strain DSM 25811 / CCM 8410 / CCUG 62505 / LMG 26954 / E90) TaxID=1285928 RepID=A0A1G6PX30_NIADE|nr:putative transcriptional regulator [Niabella drilacis]
MDDPNFFKVVLLITEHNENGAMGFVLNKPFPRTLNELVEFRQCAPFKLYEGGPVDQEHLFFIHRRPDLIEEGLPVSPSVYSGGNFKQAVMHINGDPGSDKDLKLFIGYCGWDTGELETEIEKGFWRISPGSANLLFSPAEGLWEALIR